MALPRTFVGEAGHGHHCLGFRSRGQPKGVESQTPACCARPPPPGAARASGTPRISPYVARVSFTLWQQCYPIGKWAAEQGWKKGYTAVSDFIPGHDSDAFRQGSFFAQIIRKYDRTRLGLHELEAELLGDVRGAWADRTRLAFMTCCWNTTPIPVENAPVFHSLRFPQEVVDCFPSQRWQTASSHQRNQPKGSRWVP